VALKRGGGAIGDLQRRKLNLRDLILKAAYLWKANDNTMSQGWVWRWQQVKQKR
jgi:hypothetical protein